MKDKGMILRESSSGHATLPWISSQQLQQSLLKSATPNARICTNVQTCSMSK